MKVFKQLFRSVVFVGLVGGWALAASAVHLVRTPTNKFPVILTKDHLCFTDTYADTRNWTLADDTSHPALVTRLIELHRTDLLAHTVNGSAGAVEAQLATAAQSPASAQSASGFADKTKAELKNAADAVKSKIN
jgi:hypothetical protein